MWLLIQTGQNYNSIIKLLTTITTQMLIHNSYMYLTYRPPALSICCAAGFHHWPFYEQRLKRNFWQQIWWSWLVSFFLSNLFNQTSKTQFNYSAAMFISGVFCVNFKHVNIAVLQTNYIITSTIFCLIKLLVLFNWYIHIIHQAFLLIWC